MPVKIRCKGCGKVLNVPDRVRGKAVKCPACQTVLKIPAAKAAAPRRQREAVPKAVDDDNFLAGVDLRRAADSRVRVCVKCGAEVDEEVIDCPECGHNVETGIMSEAVRKRRARRGPDPDEFWGVAWTGSFKFVRDNMNLVWRTAGYWVLFLTLVTYCSLWFAMIVALSAKIEPLLFFGGVLTVLVFGIFGWYWHMSVHVIRHTMSAQRDKPVPHFHFDFFQCIALGLKAIFWPHVLLLGVWAVVYAVVAIKVAASGVGSASADVVMGEMGRHFFYRSGLMIGPTTTFRVLDGLVEFTALLVFPLAMVHMSMPYTYKAWTPFHMAIALGKNILPALYFLVMRLTATLPFVITALILHLTWQGGLVGLFGDIIGSTFDLIDWFLKLVGLAPPEEAAFARAWYQFLMVVTLSAIPFAIFYTPFCIAAAFGAVFLTRANGYIGLYFRDKLDLVKEQKEGVPCGFWPRYLAYLVDWLVLNIAAAIITGVYLGLVWLVRLVTLDYLVHLFTFLYIAALIVMPWLYFAKPQSSTLSRASLGKSALGIIVTTDGGENMDFAHATGRYFVKIILGAVTLGVSYLLAAFMEKKRALHDTICGTLVVWKGDDERDQT